jgi:hypothetical protein
VSTRRPRHVDAARAWAREQRLGTVGLKSTLVVLAGYATEDQVSSPGVDLIADETEQDVRTVRRHLQLLREVGLIVTVKRYRAGGLRDSDQHHLQLDRIVTTGDVAAARSKIRARTLEGTVPCSQEGMVSSGLEGTMPPTLEGTVSDPRGHDAPSSKEDLPTEGLPDQDLHACMHATREHDEDAPVPAAAPPEPGDPRERLRERLISSPAVVALRRALAVEELEGPSWARLTAEQLAEIVCLVDSRGAARMASKARHQARSHPAGPPAHVAAWLPAWRELVPIAPERPAEAAPQEVPPEERADAPETVKAMLEAYRARRTGAGQQSGGPR